MRCVLSTRGPLLLLLEYEPTGIPVRVYHGDIHCAAHPRARLANNVTYRGVEPRAEISGDFCRHDDPYFQKRC
jgi:hypothetical protein